MQFRSNEAQWSYMMFSLQTSVLPPPTPGNFYGNIIPYQQAPSSTQEPPTQNIQNFQEIKQNNNNERAVEVQLSQGSQTPSNNQKKKVFKKDKYCPVRNCKKKYSSRIALRAHLRKEHPNWMEETSDYEP